MSSNAYTYLVGWSSLNLFYYGRRTKIGCCPNELMKSYFTSSKVIKEYIKKFGIPDIIQIRRVFSSKTKCAAWENKVLRRLNAAQHPKLLNKTNGDINFDNTGFVTVKCPKTGNIMGRVTVDDPRYLSGDLIPVAAGKTAVIDQAGNKFRVAVDDPRYLSGELVSIAKGLITIENIHTLERTRVPTGTKINRETHRYVTGKPLGTKESDNTKKLKSDSAKNKLTVICKETGNIIRLDKKDAMILIEKGTHDILIKTIKKVPHTEESKRKLSIAALSRTPEIKKKINDAFLEFNKKKKEDPYSKYTTEIKYNDGTVFVFRNIKRASISKITGLSEFRLSPSNTKWMTVTRYIDV